MRCSMQSWWPLCGAYLFRTFFFLDVMNMHSKLPRDNFQPCNVRIGVIGVARVKGGGGGPQGISKGEGPLRGPTAYPLFHKLTIIFWQKMFPLCKPSTDKWHLFHIPSLKHCFPLNCCKFTVFFKGSSYFLRGCHSVTIGRNIVLLIHNGKHVRSKKNINTYLYFLNEMLRF